MGGQDEDSLGTNVCEIESVRRLPVEFALSLCSG